MLFSILVPVYNVERYLMECLNSIVSQDFNDYEIILIDDGSTDLSGKLCDDFGIQYLNKCKVRHKKNEGLLAARRDAFDLACGEYCVCLDSDDYLSKGTLQFLSELIYKYDPDFILYDLYVVDEKGKSRNLNESKHILKDEYLYSSTQILKDTLLDTSYNHWSMCAKCVKTKIAREKFDYKRYYGVNYGEDTLQSIILYNTASNFVYTSRRIYNYRIGSGMTKKLPIKFVDDFYKIIQLMYLECENWGSNLEKRIDHYFVIIIFEYINNVVYSGGGFKRFKILISQLINREEVSGAMLNFNCRVEDTKEYKKCFLFRLLLNRHYFLSYILILVVKLKCLVKSKLLNIINHKKNNFYDWNVRR